jgi:hypothetical protein
MTLRELFKMFTVADFDAGVKAIPECGESALHDLNGDVGAVGDNLI